MIIARTEEKYVLSHVEYECLKRGIRNFMQMDRGRLYWIRSLYFDTPYDEDYWDKVSGINARKKIRLRIYSLENEFAKLEIKNKIGDHSVKETLQISRSEAGRMIKGDTSFLKLYDEKIAAKIWRILNTENRIPTIIVDYLREAYWMPVNHVRLTFDSEIKASMNTKHFYMEEVMTPITFADKIIMEVKYDGALPDILSKMLRCVDLSRESVSKYCLSRMQMGH